MIINNQYIESRLKMKSRMLFYGALFFCSFVFWECIQNSSEQRPERTYMQDQMVKNDLQDDFNLFSDPSDRKMIIIYQSDVIGKGMINIYYTDGKLFSRKEVAINKGPNNWEYYFPEKTRGLFIVKFTSKNILRTARVEKLIY